ncbi:hypothetical protein WJX75_005231 [Coccomyxa subellipsoidea]|uniref:Uncharacterized protein n=1 Tax=Coccomyxa subellipsoidea TaxID=248742 RepID=A0ABR2Z339_9CHLO
MAAQSERAPANLTEDETDVWWAKATLRQVLGENAQLRARLAQTKAALSYSMEVLQQDSPSPRPLLEKRPPSVDPNPPISTTPGQSEKRQKLC